VKINLDQKVTVCRLSGDLKSMIVAKGKIVDCKNSDDCEPISGYCRIDDCEPISGYCRIDDCEPISGYCRIMAKIKIDAPIEFIHKTSGNHHVVVYGDYTEELRELALWDCYSRGLIRLIRSSGVFAPLC